MFESSPPLGYKYPHDNFRLICMREHIASYQDLNMFRLSNINFPILIFIATLYLTQIWHHHVTAGELNMFCRFPFNRSYSCTLVSKVTQLVLKTNVVFHSKFVAPVFTLHSFTKSLGLATVI